MTMNFFKKVMTFFSAIWNAILWRKPEKKSKPAAQTAEEEDQAEQESKPISEAEKLFVDVPLHSSEAGQLTEQELLINDEVPAVFAPVVAHNIESRTFGASGINEYSSSVQLFGFEDEPSPVLSFFSEPVRDDEEPETPLPSSKDENGKLSAEENVTSETYSIGPEASAADDITVNQVNEILDLPVPEELPTPPSDPISKETSNGHMDLSNLTLAALDALPISGNFPGSPSKEIPQLTILNDGALVETQPSTDINMPSSLHQTITFSTSKINPDLNYLAIGDEIHLFDHEGVTDDFLAEEEFGKNEMAQKSETNQPVRDDPIPMPTDITTLGPPENLSINVEVNQNISTSSTEVVPIGISVSSSQAIPDALYVKAGSSKYSTNYMVKSDSLVNFLPEGGDVNDAADLKDVLMEIAEKSLINEEEKEVPFDYNIPILKEGGLEEMMCTPRGVLKLSGDHHVDCADVNGDPKQTHDVKTAVDDFLIDDFSFEEPLLTTHHLEGSILEESSFQRGNLEDFPIFQEILNRDETRLGNSEFVEDTDAMMNEEYHTKHHTISRSRSIIQDEPDLPNMPKLKNGSPKLGNEENEEDSKSPCRFKQLTNFHLDDEPDHIGIHFKGNEPAPEMPTVRYGETPASSGLSESIPSEKETSSSSHAMKAGSTNRFTTDSQYSGGQYSGFLDGPDWRVNIPLSEIEVIKIHEYSPTLRVHENSCSDISVDKISHTQDGENTDDYYPFIDCSSYLFRIPEEIRKDTGFNPCVGAAPSRRSGYASSTNLESVRYDSEHDGYEDKYPNVNSMVPNHAGPVPLINACIPDDYKNTRIEKQPDDYNLRQVSQEVGTFWGSHPGLDRDQQQVTVGHPMSCIGNYYEGEDVNVIPSAAYENAQSTVCANPEEYGYINPYGSVEFPMLRFPLCTPQTQSGFVLRGTLAPVVFPIGPMDVSETEVLSPLINLDATVQNEHYPIPHSWGGYPPNAHLQNDEEDRGIASMVEVRGMTPIENLSCTGTNDDHDDLDLHLDNNPILDPYFQLAENNSLHTVRSKADSYSGSLFCESLRSLLSHNTENENILPSFSCSSVQGCCPSVVLQSCGTTLSNYSLPSIIVEETNYSKSVDEDYLATEKFMNDVNTALNESVLDQVQGHVDLHSNLLGRGDGSMPTNPGQSGQEDHTETQENDMLRNSLGENISINNSKLTLLDGVLGAENGVSQPEPMHNVASELEGEGSISLHEYFWEVLDSLLENVLMTSADRSTSELSTETAEINTHCRGDVDDPHSRSNSDRDLVVQSMMFVEGMPDELRGTWQNQEIHESNEKIVTLAEVVVVGDSEVNDEEALKDSGDSVMGSTQASVADDIPNRRGRRNRRRRKKLSDVESRVDPEPCAEVTGISIGDGVRTPQDRLVETKGDKTEESPPILLEPGQKRSEAVTSDSKSDGELFGDENSKDSSKNEQDSAQIEVECVGNQEEDDEPGENSGNPNNKRRRNRRRKRKN